MSPETKRTLRQAGFFVVVAGIVIAISMGLDQTHLADIARQSPWIAYAVSAALYGITVMAVIAAIAWAIVRRSRRPHPLPGKGPRLPR